MNVGLSTSPTQHTIDIAVVAKHAEDLGFDSIWVPEHPIIPVHTETPYPSSRDGTMPGWCEHEVDPFVALARASAVTTNLKLGTAVILVPEHNPLIMAKEIATLDMYSRGRFLFGIGGGWLREEMEIMGGDFDHRWTQTREAVLAMKELWTKTESEYHGKYYDFPPVYSFPRPVQRPHPPIILGGTAPNVLKRIATWGDGWIPAGLNPEQLKAGRATLDKLALAAGRDPTSIEISIFGQPPDSDLMKKFQEAGADRFVVSEPPWLWKTSDEEVVLDEIKKLADALIT